VLLYDGELPTNGCGHPYDPLLLRDAMLTRYLLSSCVRPSVRPSVARRYCTKTAKHRITQTTSYTIAQYSSFPMPKISAKCHRANMFSTFQNHIHLVCIAVSILKNRKTHNVRSLAKSFRKCLVYIVMYAILGHIPIPSL